jgi:hypothetical protein
LRRADGTRFVVKRVKLYSIVVPVEIRKVVEPRFTGFSVVAPADEVLLPPLKFRRKLPRRRPRMNSGFSYRVPRDGME